MTKPHVDFFCIGAAKSATTWLAECLAEHPEVCVSNPKEPNFFARRVDLFPERPGPRFMADWDWYANCFAAALPGQKVGDFSTQHLPNADAAKLVKENYPKAKILVMLRDPAARLHSHYWFRRQFQPRTTVPKHFRDALHVEHFVRRSRYWEQLEPWLAEFGRKRVLIVTDIEIQGDAAAAIGRVCKFLGVDPTFTPAHAGKRIQPPTAPTHRQRVAHRTGNVLRRAGLGGIVAWGRRLASPLTKRRRRQPKMSREDRQAAWKLLEDDVAKLEQELDLDVRGWRP